MNILVGGSLRNVFGDPGLGEEFVRELGHEIVRQGHVRLDGCLCRVGQTGVGTHERRDVDDELHAFSGFGPTKLSTGDIIVFELIVVLTIAAVLVRRSIV